MQATSKTIDHGTLRRLVDTGAHVGADVVGEAGAWGIVINYGSARETLVAARGEARMFRKFETLATYLKNLGITECTVNLAGFDAEAKNAGDEKRSLLASNRLKAAHAAAAHDQWTLAKVQASLNDDKPNVSQAKVMRDAQALINKKRKLHAGKKASA